VINHKKQKQNLRFSIARPWRKRKGKDDHRSGEEMKKKKRRKKKIERKII
jgi:hypothetical protein